MRRAALAVVTALLAGCCAQPTLGLLAWEDRLELEARDGYALVATVLEGGERWGYGEPAAVVSALAAHYRPPAGGAEPDDPRTLASVREAPGALAQALAAADAALRARGYRPVGAGAAPGFVLQVGVTEVAGRLQRVALHVGAELEERFAPRRTSLEARVPLEDDPCPVTVEELVEALSQVLPERLSAE